MKKRVLKAMLEAVDYKKVRIKYSKDGKQHDVELASALTYDKAHPAYKKAQEYLKKVGADVDDVVNGKKGKKPEQTPKTAIRKKDHVASTKTYDPTDYKKPKVKDGDPRKQEIVPLKVDNPNWDGPKDADGTLSGNSDSLDTERKVVSLMRRLGKIANYARERGKKAPNFDLCTVSIPGTNLFCGENKGIPRKQMPQLKGTPAEGTPAYKMAKAHQIPAKVIPMADGDAYEVDIEELFMQSLSKMGKKLTPKIVPAASLKATQTELVGSKVAGMMDAIIKDPDGKASHAIRQPIFISKDGYILDGHHRWATVVGLDMAQGNPDDIEMNVIEVDMGIEELVDYTNKFATKMGIQQVSGAVKKESVASLANTIVENIIARIVLGDDCGCGK